MLRHLLIILNVVEVNPFHPVAEVILIYVGVSGQLERNRHCLCFLEAETLKVLLIVELLLYLIKNHAQSSLDPKHHVITLP